MKAQLQLGLLERSWFNCGNYFVLSLTHIFLAVVLDKSDFRHPQLR